jgi:hypothetical protein
MKTHEAYLHFVLCRRHVTLSSPWASQWPHLCTCFPAVISRDFLPRILFKTYASIVMRASLANWSCVTTNWSSVNKLELVK